MDSAPRGNDRGSETRACPRKLSEYILSLIFPEPVSCHRRKPPPSSAAVPGSTIPTNIDMTALYLERYLNYGLSLEELRSGKPIIGIAQTGSDLSPCNRHHPRPRRARPRGHSRGRRHRHRIPGPPDPGNGQAAYAPRSTGTSPISASSKFSTAIRSTAWC